MCAAAAGGTCAAERKFARRGRLESTRGAQASNNMYVRVAVCGMRPNPLPKACRSIRCPGRYVCGSDETLYLWKLFRNASQR